MKKFLKTYRKFNYHTYLYPFWKEAILLLALSGLTMGLSLVNPYLTKLVVDRAYESKDLKLFITLVIIGGVLFILNNAIGGISGYLNTYIRIKIKFSLTVKIFKKLQALPYNYFQNSTTGQSLYKFNYDIENIANLISGVIPQIVFTLIKTFIVLIIIFFLNWKLASVALILMPPVYYITYYFNKKLEKKWKNWIESNQKVFGMLQEILTHIHLIKAFGKEREHKRKYIGNLIESIRYNLESQKWQSVISFINMLICRLVLGIILFYGGYEVIKGELLLGSLIAIGLYLNQLSGLQNSFTYLIQNIVLNYISCERLDGILNAEIEKEKNTVSLKNCEGHIEFKKVTFSYEEEKPLLDNLSFSIPAGSFAGLVGPSGCGKTTMVNLILRLYNIEKGKILLDGYNNVSKSDLFRHTGVALQDPFLWNDTVENNIKYGNSDATDEE
ncbi:MAG TPA: ABC transporter ATP-binding protein, partial [Candidatus Eremiobacteraeota bacterium]|nr:ABC transporter ATP-binding protein [Candidatus Eremiobacteraeota bacterium]